MRCYSAYPQSSYNTYNNSESQNNINNIFYSNNRQSEFPQLVFQRKTNTNYKDEKLSYYKNKIGLKMNTADNNNYYMDDGIIDNASNYMFIPKNNISRRLNSAKYPSLSKRRKNNKNSNVVDLELNYYPKKQIKIHNCDLNTKNLLNKKKNNKIEDNKKTKADQNLIYNEYNNYLKSIKLLSQRERIDYSNFLLHFQDKQYLTEIAKSINKKNKSKKQKKSNIDQPNLFIDHIIKNISRRIEFLGMNNNTITEREVMNLLEKEAFKLNETIDKNMEAYCKIKHFSVIIKNKAKENNIKQNTYLIPFLNEILQPYYEEININDYNKEEIKSEVSNQSLKTNSTELIINKDKVYKIKTNLKPINENKMLSREISNDSSYESGSYTSENYPLFGTMNHEDNIKENEENEKKKKNLMKKKKLLSCRNLINRKYILDKIDFLKKSLTEKYLLHKKMHKKQFKKILFKNQDLIKSKNIEKKNIINDQLYRIIGKHKITATELIHDLYSGGNTVNNYKDMKYAKEKTNNEIDKKKEEEEEKLKQKQLEEERLKKLEEEKMKKIKLDKKDSIKSDIEIKDIKEEFSNKDLYKKKNTVDVRPITSKPNIINNNQFQQKRTFESKLSKEKPSEKKVEFNVDEIKEKKIEKNLKNKEEQIQENKKENIIYEKIDENEELENNNNESRKKTYLKLDSEIELENENEKKENNHYEKKASITKNNNENLSKMPSLKKRESFKFKVISPQNKNFSRAKTMNQTNTNNNNLKRESFLKHLDSFISQKQKPNVNNNEKKKEEVKEDENLFNKIPKKYKNMKKKPTLKKMGTKKKINQNKYEDLTVNDDFMEKLLNKQNEEENKKLEKEKEKEKNEKKEEKKIIEIEKKEIPINKKKENEEIPILNIKSSFFQNENKNKNKKVQIAQFNLRQESEDMKSKNSSKNLLTNRSLRQSEDIGEQGNIDNHEYEKIANLLSDENQRKRSFKKLKTKTNIGDNESKDISIDNINNDDSSYNEEEKLNEYEKYIHSNIPEKKKKGKNNFEKLVDEINRLKNMSIEEYIEFLDKQYHEKVDEYTDYIKGQKEEDRINKFVYSLVNQMDKAEFTRKLKSKYCQPVNYVDTLGNKLENL